MASLPSTIAFRTDASVDIGTGHVMRCLSLADALSAGGARCLFLCRPHSGHLLALIGARGHQALALPPPGGREAPGDDDLAHAHWLGTDQDTDAADTRSALGSVRVDWLVVDHYGLDRRWELAMRASCYRLMVIDDLADRWHDCDLLLDQNLGRAEADYSALLPPWTLACIGPQYALLRPEFGQLRAASPARRAQPELRRMLITLGGVDKGNVTGRVLAALRSCRLPADLAVTVVMGPHAPWLAQVQAQAAAMPWPTQVLAGVANMAQLMAESDLAIGAAGSTSWERCCLGLPAIQLVLADNQAEAAAALSALGAVASIGPAAGLADELAVLLMQLDGPRLQQLSQRAALVCDGRGTPGIAAELLKMLDHHEENL